MSAAYRLNRLFHARSGRCIDVAVDHGFFGEPRFLAGIEDMAKVVEALVAAAPDAIQLSRGQAPLLQRLPGRDKPALVLRVDVANVYGEQPPRAAFSHVVDDAIGHAVRLDAACVCVNLFDIPGADELRRQCIENVTALRTAADRAGMALMVEPLVMTRRPGRLRRRRRHGPHRRVGAPGRRARSRRDQGRPDRRPHRLPRGRHRGRRARPRPRRRPRLRRGDPRAHAHRARAGRARDRLRAQRHPAPRPGGHGQRAEAVVHGDAA